MKHSSRKWIALVLAATLMLGSVVTGAAAEAEDKYHIYDPARSTTYTGSILAAVNVNFNTENSVSGSFSDVKDAPFASENDTDGEIGLSGVYSMDINPETGEPCYVMEPQFAPLVLKDAPEGSVDAQKDMEVEYASVGSTRTIVDDEGVSRTMKCLYVGSHCTVWGCTSDSSISSSLMLSSANAALIGSQYDSYYSNIVNSFGSWYDADGDGKLAIYCYDIEQSYRRGVAGAYTAGYFWAVNLINSSGYINGNYFGSHPAALGTDCIHLDTYPGMSNSRTDIFGDLANCYSTLVHESQHLINFSYCVSGGAGTYYDGMETYLNEGFSMASEHMICGASSTASRISYFNGSSYTQGHPLTYWDRNGNTLCNYSNSYLFGQYIRTRYAQQTGTNGNTIYKATLQARHTAHGGDTLTRLANTLGTTPTQLVKDFWAAVYLKKSSGVHGFNGESWANAINPHVNTSFSGTTSGIKNGSVKYYQLPSGGYTVSSANNIEFVTINNGGATTEVPPTISDATIVRVSPTKATFTFTADKAGVMKYKVSSTWINSLSGLTKSYNITAGSNSVTLGISSGVGATNLLYAVGQTANSLGEIRAIAISDYVEIHQYTYTNNYNGTHRRVCSICGADEVVSCDFTDHAEGSYNYCVCGSRATRGSSSYITVGNGSSTSRFYPYCNYYKNSSAQIIYPQSELGAAKVISSIAFQVSSVYAHTTSSLRIYMGHTNKSSFASQNEAIPLSQMTLVYSGSPTLGESSGWETMTLNTAFAYNGRDNLVIAIFRSSTDYVSDLYYKCTEVPGSSVGRYSDNDASYGSTSMTTYNEVSSCRPNLRIPVYSYTYDHNEHMRTNPVTTSATCTEAGSTRYTCDYCGETYSIDVAPLGHRARYTDYDNGTHRIRCSRCGLDERVSCEYTDHQSGAFWYCACGSKATRSGDGGGLTVGTESSTTQEAPFGNYYRYSGFQILYRQSELGGARSIPEIAFKVSQASSLSTSSVKIYMGHTNKSSFSGTSDAIPVSQMSLVYSGSPTIGSTAGWETFRFNTSFNYNGRDNLVIAVFRSSSTWNGSLYYASSNVSNSVLGRFSDSSSQCGDSSYSSYSSRLSARPIIKIPGAGYTYTHAPRNPFSDMHDDDWFYDSVMWAYTNGITTGTSETTFDPSAVCNRAQVVTFLWRAAGMPEPSSYSNPFEDVSADTWYYKPVLWAVGQNITNGTTSTTFEPDSMITRGQVVTFLYRYMGSPSVNGLTNPFWDVHTEYYYRPVLWAANSGITSGYPDNSFQPNNPCNRAEVVTFLYRNAVHPAQ